MNEGSQRDPRLVGLALIVGIALITVVIFSGIFRAPFQASTRTVTVDFTKAAQLHKGDEVRIDGDIDGKVSKIEPGPIPEQARVTLKVDKNAGPLYRDATAHLSAKTLLAGVFYVALSRGTPASGPLGDHVIDVKHSTAQVEIEDLTNIFKGGAVPGFQTMPGELAKVFADPSVLPTALKTVNHVAPAAAGALQAIRGTQPRTDLKQLVASTSRTVAALDTPNNDLKTVVSGAAATLQVTGRRAAELREAIHAGPGVTYDLVHTLARLDTTLDTADGLVTRLRGPAPEVAPTLRQLRPTVVSAARLLTNADPTVKEARRLLLATGNISVTGVPVLEALKPSLKQYDDTILPYLNRDDPETGHNTIVMIGGTAAGFGGASAEEDQNGHFIRFPASAGTSSPSLYLPCSTALVDPDAKALLACDTFSTAVKDYLHYLPNDFSGGGG